ncbi:hypothetical protein OPKNFCMD_3421 [Methylobacterium crusticola]|uniref:DUF6894 domain-containing protein n=1 Tax=Methylobacterium crusticola TaxID=1697972 RepID=A0ABQ4R1E9_9HYPH|nr:hypothetical protein [Methylobacterium crusticola]GJD50676.1 hypothetical protein OPKNFCMD_3421 [Methylobacterium crusticola]
MQRYFFDLKAGDWDCRDDLGMILCGSDEVRAEATRTALEFARATLSGVDPAELRVRVRDRAGAHVLTVALALSIKGPETARVSPPVRAPRPFMIRAA